MLEFCVAVRPLHTAAQTSWNAAFFHLVVHFYRQHLNGKKIARVLQTQGGVNGVTSHLAHSLA